MKTKQEYIDILGQMEELYYNSDNCTLAMNLFKEDIKLLTGLINEHFEEKTETNYEHFKYEIIKNCVWSFALVDGKPHQCSDVSCCDCGFSTGHGCAEKVKEWLKSPHKNQTYKLSQFEYDLIQTYSYVHEGYKLSKFNRLIELKDKGYFKCVDYDTKIQDILSNCEVIK